MQCIPSERLCEEVITSGGWGITADGGMGAQPLPLPILAAPGNDRTSAHAALPPPPPDVCLSHPDCRYSSSDLYQADEAEKWRAGIDLPHLPPGIRALSSRACEPATELGVDYSWLPATSVHTTRAPIGVWLCASAGFRTPLDPPQPTVWSPHARPTTCTRSDYMRGCSDFAWNVGRTMLVKNRCEAALALQQRNGSKDVTEAASRAVKWLRAHSPQCTHSARSALCTDPCKVIEHCTVCALQARPVTCATTQGSRCFKRRRAERASGGAAT